MLVVTPRTQTGQPFTPKPEAPPGAAVRPWLPADKPGQGSGTDKDADDDREMSLVAWEKRTGRTFKVSISAAATALATFVVFLSFVANFTLGGDSRPFQPEEALAPKPLFSPAPSPPGVRANKAAATNADPPAQSSHPSEAAASWVPEQAPQAADLSSPSLPEEEAAAATAATPTSPPQPPVAAGVGDEVTNRADGPLLPSPASRPRRWPPAAIPEEGSDEDGMAEEHSVWEDALSPSLSPNRQLPVKKETMSMRTITTVGGTRRGSQELFGCANGELRQKLQSIHTRVSVAAKIRTHLEGADELLEGDSAASGLHTS